MAKQNVKRREFLKKGIGLAGFSFIPFVLDPKTAKFNPISDKHLENILIKYGGEFGHVKPVIRRKNHGHI